MRVHPSALQSWSPPPCSVLLAGSSPAPGACNMILLRNRKPYMPTCIKEAQNRLLALYPPRISVTLQGAAGHAD